MSINPGDVNLAPFLSISVVLDTSQTSIFVLDVTPEKLRSLADDLASAQTALAEELAS
ncbi:MAG: hypothetical protein ABFD96_11365 [Armatimonadia bacterium]